MKFCPLWSHRLSKMVLELQISRSGQSLPAEEIAYNQIAPLGGNKIIQMKPVIGTK